MDKFWYNQDIVYDFKAQLQGNQKSEWSVVWVILVNHYIVEALLLMPL